MKLSDLVGAIEYEIKRYGDIDVDRLTIEYVDKEISPATFHPVFWDFKGCGSKLLEKLQQEISEYDGHTS